MIETEEADFYCPYCPTNGTRGGNQLHCPYYSELKPNYLLWFKYKKKRSECSPETRLVVENFLQMVSDLSEDSCSLALTMYFLLVVDKTDKGLSNVL